MTSAFSAVLRVILIASLSPVAALAATDASAPLAEQAQAAMKKATAFMTSIATEGGYLWRYSPDLKERAGENPATPTQIWLQPPGTPAMGLAFVRAYEATGETTYLEAAQAAADALARGQLESGGWDNLVDFDPAEQSKWYLRSDVGRIPAAEAAKRRNTTTFDDNKTQSALRLLLAVVDAAPNARDARAIRIREARDYGLAKLLEAQRPNGGFPQRWDGERPTTAKFPVQPARFPADYPRKYPKQPYGHFYTLNDNTHRDCVMTLLDAAKRTGRPEFRAAALRGGDFLVAAQLPEPQPVWAQQYNPQLEPAWARAFEPPSVCAAESTGVMKLLVDLYLETGDAEYIEPLPRAIAWFKRSELSPGVWARMYELRTNVPVFGDRDGTIKYRIEDLSPERQTGYSWKGDYGVKSAIAYYDDVMTRGRDAILAKRAAAAAKAKDPKTKAAQAKKLEPAVREIVGALDAQGRWLVDYRGSRQIRTDAFIRNLNTLSEYVAAVR